jgi:hypothetical protein
VNAFCQCNQVCRTSIHKACRAKQCSIT